MKKNLKILFVIILFLIVISITAACTEGVEDSSNSDKNNEEIEKEVENISAGFIKDKYEEDDNMIIEFAYTKNENGDSNDNLIIKTEDQDLFNELETLAHYMFTYDDANNLISIEKNESIKEIMEKESKQEGDKEGKEEEKASKNEKSKVISSVKDVSTEDLTLIDSHLVNIYGDEKEEKIEMYVDSEKDDKGNIMWDDGQNWKLVVKGNEYSFILFQDYLQLASMDFFVYTIDDEFYISTLDSGTANLTLIEYEYNKENQTFEKRIKSDIKGNVNMLYESTPRI